MAFTFNTNLADPISRIRFAVGDTATPELFDDTLYTAALDLNGGDELAATQQVAAGLAIRYAQQPDSIADAGSALTWRERVAQWNRIATGAVDEGTAAGSGADQPRIGRIQAGQGYVVR